MEISQNLWIQLTPDQFSDLGLVKTYPEIDPLCLSMRFRKNPSWDIGFFMTPKFWDRRSEIEWTQILAALPGAQLREGASPP